MIEIKDLYRMSEGWKTPAPTRVYPSIDSFILKINKSKNYESKDYYHFNEGSKWPLKRVEGDITSYHMLTHYEGEAPECDVLIYYGRIATKEMKRFDKVRNLCCLSATKEAILSRDGPMWFSPGLSIQPWYTDSPMPMRYFSDLVNNKKEIGLASVFPFLLPDMKEMMEFYIKRGFLSMLTGERMADCGIFIS